MANLETGRLPDEIWMRIFENFEGPLPATEWWLFRSQFDRQPPANLASLCRVCRHFRRIAQPLLYRTSIVGSDDDDAKTSNHIKFVQSLIGNPTLGQHVRKFSIIDDVYPSGLSRDFPANNIPESSWAALQLPPTYKTLLKDFCCTQYFCFAAFALAYAQNVQVLDTATCEIALVLSWMLSGMPNLDQNSLLEVMRTSGKRNGKACGKTGDDNIPLKAYANFGLPHLQEVRMRCAGGSEETIAIGQIEPILLHPKLNTLRLLGIDWRQECVGKLQRSNYSSNLTCLELKECAIDARGLKSLLRWCQNLRDLKIELGDSRRTCLIDDDEWEVDLNLFGQALRTYGKGLQSLDLNFLQYETHQIVDNFIGSLQALVFLRHLAITINHLMGEIDKGGPGNDIEDVNGIGNDGERVGRPTRLRLKDLLPPSLETCYFHYDDQIFGADYGDEERKKTDGEIYDMIVSKRFPRLREVKLERFWGHAKFEREIVGWSADNTEEHLWKTISSSGLMRTIINFSKN